jgi:hypothetical protein
MLPTDHGPQTSDPLESQSAAPVGFQRTSEPRKRWREMTKEERNQYVRQNPRVMYAWVAAFSAFLSLLFFGLAQVQEQPAYLSYDKSTRPMIWAALSAILALYGLWMAWRSPRGKP